MKAKLITAQKIHAILRKAGFRRSEWIRSGMVRGWGRSTTGYKLSAIGSIGSPQFSLYYVKDSHGYGSPPDPAPILAKYRDVLAAAGLPIQDGQKNDILIG